MLSLCNYRQLFTSRFVLRNIRKLNASVTKDISLKQVTDAIEIKWNGCGDEAAPSVWSKYHHIWLRDNCQCSECFHPETHQRILDTLKVNVDVTPRSVELNNRSTNLSNSNTTALTIEWEDGHKSVYPLSWLKKHSYELKSAKEFDSHPKMESNGIEPTCRCTVWGNEITTSPPLVKYTDYMNSDDAFLEWSDKVEEYGFCFIDGVPLEPVYSKQVLERAGVLRNTFYGKFWDAEMNSSHTNDLEIGDTAYTGLAIDSHTDGNYFTEAPFLQMLHIIYFNGTGGESSLVDGFKLAEVISEENPYHYEILSKVPLKYHYKDKKHQYYSSFTPFIIDAKSGEVSQVHFNNCDRSPVDASSLKALRSINPTGSVTDIYGAIQTFISTMRMNQYQYRFRLEPGKALIFNNHRVLHARTAFTNQRRMCGGYVNKEDWKSRVIVTRDKLMT